MGRLLCGGAPAVGVAVLTSLRGELIFHTQGKPVAIFLSFSGDGAGTEQ